MAGTNLPRQRVNYHLRALERAELVELVEERPRRTRLVTFTLETEVGFATPQDFERFTDELADALATTAASYHAPGRRYRVVAGGHPAPRTEAA